MELLNVYRVFFKKREPIVVAASNIFEACERVMKLPLHDFISDPIYKIDYHEPQIYV
jgi:hypothetical protein